MATWTGKLPNKGTGGRGPTTNGNEVGIDFDIIEAHLCDLANGTGTLSDPNKNGKSGVTGITGSGNTAPAGILTPNTPFTPGGSALTGAGWLGQVQQQIDAAINGGIPGLRLRIESGLWAPVWMLNLDNGPSGQVQHGSLNNGNPIVIPIHWGTNQTTYTSGNYRIAYKNILTGLLGATVYTDTAHTAATTIDSHPLIREITCGMCMLYFGEVFIRFLPQAGLTAGNTVNLTSALDFAAMQDMCSIHIAASTKTVFIIDDNASDWSGASGGLTFTQGILDYINVNGNGAGSWGIDNASVGYTGSPYTGKSPGTNQNLYFGTGSKNGTPGNFSGNMTFGPLGSTNFVDPIRNSQAIISGQMYPVGQGGLDGTAANNEACFQYAASWGCSSLEVVSNPWPTVSSLAIGNGFLDANYVFPYSSGGGSAAPVQNGTTITAANPSGTSNLALNITQTVAVGDYVRVTLDVHGDSALPNTFAITDGTHGANKDSLNNTYSLITGATVSHGFLHSEVWGSRITNPGSAQVSWSWAVPSGTGGCGASEANRWTGVGGTAINDALDVAVTTGNGTTGPITAATSATLINNSDLVIAHIGQIGSPTIAMASNPFTPNGTPYNIPDAFAQGGGGDNVQAIEAQTASPASPAALTTQAFSTTSTTNNGWTCILMCLKPGGGGSGGGASVLQHVPGGSTSTVAAGTPMTVANLLTTAGSTLTLVVGTRGASNGTPSVSGGGTWQIRGTLPATSTGTVLTAFDLTPSSPVSANGISITPAVSGSITYEFFELAGLSSNPFLSAIFTTGGGQTPSVSLSPAAATDITVAAIVWPSIQTISALPSSPWTNDTSVTGTASALSNNMQSGWEAPTGATSAQTYTGTLSASQQWVACILDYSTTSTASVPGAPTIGTATNVLNTATVPFTPPASTGGAPIQSYTCIPWLNVSGTYVQQPSPPTVTTSPFVIPNLALNSQYKFSVFATNTKGNGAQSALSNAITTPSITPPPSPYAAFDTIFP